MDATGPGILKGGLLPRVAKWLVEWGSREAIWGTPASFKEAWFTCQFGPVLCDVCSLLALTRGFGVSINLPPELQGLGLGSTAFHVPACAPLGLGGGKDR